MTTTYKNAYLAQPGITDTTLYTCPANTTAIIKKCTVTNDTTTSITMIFNQVPSGGTAGPTNLVMNLKPLGPLETYECPEIVGLILTAGQILSAKFSVADQGTVDLGLVEIV